MEWALVGFVTVGCVVATSVLVVLLLHSERDLTEAQDRLDVIADKLEHIVCVHDPDRGVVLLSQEGPTHIEYYDTRKYTVYDHEHFSPLGDALIEVYTLAKGGTDGEPT